MLFHTAFLAMLLMGLGLSVQAQQDSTAAADDFEEIDWSEYDFADESAKAYCSNKIVGLSPSQFISIGYDFQGSYDVAFSPVSAVEGYQPGEDVTQETGRVLSTQGLRFGANIPVLSRNSIVIQLEAASGILAISLKILMP